MNVRAGLGFFTIPNTGYDVYDKNYIFNVTFPFIFGINKSHLEIDAGLKYLEAIGSNPGSFYPDIFAGYRYEKPTGRFYFRGGLSSLSYFNIGCGLKF